MDDNIVQFEISCKFNLPQ